MGIELTPSMVQAYACEIQYWQQGQGRIGAGSEVCGAPGSQYRRGMERRGSVRWCGVVGKVASGSAAAMLEVKRLVVQYGVTGSGRWQGVRHGNQRGYVQNRGSAV